MHIGQKRVRGVAASSHQIRWKRVHSLGYSSGWKKGYKSGRSLGQPLGLLSAGCRQCRGCCHASKENLTVMGILGWLALALVCKLACQKKRFIRSTVHDLKTYDLCSCEVAQVAIRYMCTNSVVQSDRRMCSNSSVLPNNVIRCAACSRAVCVRA